MEISLDGKAALVTGGSRGIGLATARALAGAGARVMISSRKQQALDDAAAGIGSELGVKVETFAANAGDPEGVRSCVAACTQRLGAVDILVANAATNPYMGPLVGIDVARAAKTAQVNQLGVLVWVQQAWEMWMKDHGGAVVNMASIGGMSVEPGLGYYNVTKAAVIHLTRNLAAELAPSVRVNAIAPGLVKTDFARALWEGAEDLISAHVPLGRLGEPEDVANAVVFLASDAASWITGHILVVDGGMMVGGHQISG